MWEYLEVKCYRGDGASQFQFNELGAKGWELVAIVPGCPGTQGAQTLFAYFKRLRKGT